MNGKVAQTCSQQAISAVSVSGLEVQKCEVANRHTLGTTEAEALMSVAEVASALMAAAKHDTF